MCGDPSRWTGDIETAHMTNDRRISPETFTSTPCYKCVCSPTILRLNATLGTTQTLWNNIVRVFVLFISSFSCFGTAKVLNLRRTKDPQSHPIADKCFGQRKGSSFFALSSKSVTTQFDPNMSICELFQPILHTFTN